MVKKNNINSENPNEFDKDKPAGFNYGMNEKQKRHEKDEGKRLKTALETAGVSQKAFSKIIDKGEATVTGYVQGSTRIPTYVIGRASQVCGVSINWLILGIEDPTSADIEAYQRLSADYLPDIGARIKTAAETAGLTKKDLAALLEQDELLIDIYFEGKSQPSIPNFLKISSKCNVSLDWLITGVRDARERSTDTPITTNKQLDYDTLQATIAAVEDHLHNNNGIMAPAKKAELIATLYEMFSEEENKQVDNKTVAKLIKLAS